jgi:uncharacterized membrane protein YhiD involved in acid resistance
MPDWLRDSVEAGEPLTFAYMAMVCARIGIALAAGFIVAGVYHLGMGRRSEETPTLPTTLVLLTVVIAVVTLVIGNSVARAFGLVGALSIVRFRTVVEDTRDTAFVIFAVVVGMGVGAGYVILAAVGIPAVLVAALIMRYIGNGYLRHSNGSGLALLTVRIGIGNDPDVLLSSIFAQFLAECRQVSTSTAKQGAALEVTYEVRQRAGGATFALVAALNRIEGVQGVELRPT